MDHSNNIGTDKEKAYTVIDEMEWEANETLIEKLKSIQEYINDDMPEWMQLIAIGGFVADAVKLLRWDDFSRTYNPWHTNSDTKMNMMTQDEIIEEIWGAIDYHINAPFADELNAIWHAWNTDTDYMHNEETVGDISDVILNIMEAHHPGFLDAVKRYFRFGDEE